MISSKTREYNKSYGRLKISPQHDHIWWLFLEAFSQDRFCGFLQALNPLGNFGKNGLWDPFLKGRRTQTGGVIDKCDKWGR